MTVQTVRPATLESQATQLREGFPDLYAYLVKRDRKLARALKRIPSPADIELSATWNQRRFVQKTVTDLGPGIEDLANGR